MYSNKFLKGLVLLSGLILVIQGCASHQYQFSAKSPVTESSDRNAVPLPEGDEYEAVYYYFNSMVGRPIVETMEFEDIKRAGDVNSIDEVPNSSWYEKRLGYKNISPEELNDGPLEFGPPQKPLKVVKAKFGGGNPGFIVKDKREVGYLIKFDPPDFPGMQTSTSHVVNRLFWGFGYHVPEDYRFLFAPEDLVVPEDSPLSPEAVHKVLAEVAPPVDGLYVSTASRFIDGKILGPTAEIGVRKDDQNDKVPHEDLRVQRALRIFGAFVNHSDLRIDNSLDVYVGEENKGYVKHYLLDFGEAFGAHGAEHEWLWDGYRPAFGFSHTFKSFLRFGLIPEEWEKIEFTPWKSIGAFEAEYFNPATWHESYHFYPARRCQPDDAYWAAKIIAAVTEEDLKALIEEAQFPGNGAGEYLLDVLLERKEKVLQYCFESVTPLDVTGLNDDFIELTDQRSKIDNYGNTSFKYLVKFFPANSNSPSNEIEISSNQCKFKLDINRDRILKNGYERIEIFSYNSNKLNPRKMEIHLRVKNDSIILAGVVH